jgi:uncharacterized membrane protein YjjP (DUF1212 family)
MFLFGAPSHRIKSQLKLAAQVLEIKPAVFVLHPGWFMCTFGDQSDPENSEKHSFRVHGGLALSKLHEAHIIFKNVLHDRIDPITATHQIKALLQAPPSFGKRIRVLLVFFISAMICPLGFGGSFVDLWVAGFAAVVHEVVKTFLKHRNLYSGIWE